MEPPLDRSTTWPYVDGEPGPFHYARNAHPVGVEAERQLGRARGRRGAALLVRDGRDDGGRARAAPAGRDDRARRATRTTGRACCSTSSSAGGSRHVLFDQTGPPPAGADLVWIEAPSNPLLTMPDFEAAAAHPGLVVCDATAATPVHLRPLEHGCDLVLHSATKYLGGHHDVLLGAVVGQERRARRAAARVPHAHRDRRRARRRLAAPARPEDARGPRRAPDRDGERRWRRRLEAHAAVENVRYPGFGGAALLRRRRRRRGAAGRDGDDG